jgi:hypothetical protein
VNIFYLDSDITRCAQYHCDAHVVQMILESAQILRTVLHTNGLEALYRPTDQNHPCVLWAGESLDNWVWLKRLALELNAEYQYRFNHQIPHKSIAVMKALPLPPLPSVGITERPQVIPEKYRIPMDPVRAYRHYYLAEKHYLLKYTRRPMPEWVNNG